MRAKFTKTETFEEFAETERRRTAKLNPRWNPMAIEDSVCCAPPRPKPKPTVLNVPAGAYEITGSRYPLLRLAVEVLKHRAYHWLRGEGFRD